MSDEERAKRAENMLGYINLSEDLYKELGMESSEFVNLSYKTLKELLTLASNQKNKIKKLKHQAKISSYEFKRCLETKEKMIDLLIKEFLVGTSFYYSKYDNMNEEDLYRHFEQEAMAALEKEKKNV